MIPSVCKILARCHVFVIPMMARREEVQGFSNLAGRDPNSSKMETAFENPCSQVSGFENPLRSTQLDSHSCTPMNTRKRTHCQYLVCPAYAEPWYVLRTVPCPGEAFRSESGLRSCYSHSRKMFGLPELQDCLVGAQGSIKIMSCGLCFLRGLGRGAHFWLHIVLLFYKVAV